MFSSRIVHRNFSLPFAFSSNSARFTLRSSLRHILFDETSKFNGENVDRTDSTEVSVQFSIETIGWSIVEENSVDPIGHFQSYRLDLFAQCPSTKFRFVRSIDSFAPTKFEENKFDDFREISSFNRRTSSSRSIGRSRRISRGISSILSESVEQRQSDGSVWIISIDRWSSHWRRFDRWLRFERRWTSAKQKINDDLRWRIESSVSRCGEKSKENDASNRIESKRWF